MVWDDVAAMQNAADIKNVQLRGWLVFVVIRCGPSVVRNRPR